MGRDWVIRGNYIHDIFEGLANDSMSFSVGARITGNVFARLCDNGVETENHATKVVIRQNVFLDVFEPFSYQPLKGTNWPGDIEFSQNIIANTPGPKTTLWTNGPNEARSVFKIGISLRNWKPRGPLSTNDVPKSPLAVPGGARFYNNSVCFPGGRLINVMGDVNVPLGNTVFESNLFAAEFLYSRKPADDLADGHFDFTNNLVTLAEVYSPEPNSPGAMAAGDGGAEYPDYSKFWKNPDTGDFSLVTNSPARGAGSIAGYPDIGAIQPGDTWFPLKVGPASAVMNFNDY